MAEREQCRLEREQVLRYAAAAQDFNSIHWDDEAARQSGFPGAVAHGMLTLGRLLTGVVEAAGVERLAEVNARFSAPAPVGGTVQMAVESADGDRLTGTVTDTDTGVPVLTCQMGLHGSLAPRQTVAKRTASTSLPAGDLVADRRLVVERGPATRFAATLGLRDEAFYREDAARARGLPGIPTAPTFAFALPGWGFFPDAPGNEAASVPDAVVDCQVWARTERPVAHAGQAFHWTRPLLVGEQVRARSVVVARRTRRRVDRSLDFTEVHTVLTGADDTHVLTSEMTLVVIS